MNIFSRFFGGKGENKPTEQVASDEKFPKFNYELEFLQALNKSPTTKLFGLNSYWEDRYKELLGDLKPIIKGFLSNGYLVESLKEESLSLKELKVILQNNGLSTTGNKEVLAQRISENVANKSYLRNLDSFFKLTEKGKEEIKSYREKFDIEYSDFLSCQADLFEKGELQRFISNHFKVKSDFPDQRSIGLSSNILSEKTKNILQHLSGKKELRLLSGLPKDTELKVRSVLAILDLNTSLPLPFADEYLKDLDVITLKERSVRYFGKDFVNDENISPSNCLFFEYNTLWNHYALEELKGIPNSRILKNKFFGVQILNEGCSCNEKFGVEKYPWGELDKLPLLPRHLGCKCVYNPYINI